LDGWEKEENPKGLQLAKKTAGEGGVLERKGGEHEKIATVDFKPRSSQGWAEESPALKRNGGTCLLLQIEVDVEPGEGKGPIKYE